MSGTSADGVTAVIISCLQKPRLQFFRNYTYPRSLRNEVLQTDYRDFKKALSLDWKLGTFFAAAAKRAIRESGIHPDAIGLHGQTIIHSPRSFPPFTKQIGNPDIVCAETGITTVCDFRSGDIARRGEGAPLIPLFDMELLGRDSRTVTLNLGGISNVAVLDKAKVIAFDTGPCNGIIDGAAREFCGTDMDRDGRISRSGIVSLELVSKTLTDAYFSRKPPKSLDASYFRKQFLNFCRVKQVKGADAVATAVFLAAAAIRKSIPIRQRIILSGGGVFNRTLVRTLQWMLYPAIVESISNYGWHPLAKEGGAFAFLAMKALFGKISNASEFTGAESDFVLGKILPGKHYRSLLKTICR